MAERCCAYQDGDTLWVGVTAGSVGGRSARSLDEAREEGAESVRAVLLAFLTSHAVLWLHQADRLARGGATRLLRSLRHLQQLKAALLPGLPALLGVPPAQASALQPGLCIPQLLVLAHPGRSTAERAAATAAEAQQAWQADADRRMRLLLQRCQVLHPVDSPRALCTLPPPPAPLLLLLPEPLGSGSQAELVLEALADLSLSPTEGGSSHGSSAAPSKGAALGVAAAQSAIPAPAALVAAALAPHRAAVAAASAGRSADEAAASWRPAVAKLAVALQAAAAGSGGGGGGSSVKDQKTAVPAADVAVPPEAAAAVAWQQACGDGLRQFSLASCKRAAAVASEAYRRNTPTLLPAAGHAAALQAALRLYHTLARGPAAADAAAALTEQLHSYWRDGHMQCDAVSFLGNPCCLPAHDPAQQPHSSNPAGGARPALLLASSSGVQQHSIPEPFSPAELQRAAATVAGDLASAAARVQFHVHRVDPAAVVGTGVAGRSAVVPAGPAAAGAGLDHGGAEQQGAEDIDAAARYDLSGAGHSSGEEEEEEGGGGPAMRSGRSMGSASAAEAGQAPTPAALGLPATGCWLELHVLGRRAEWKTAALAAALLLDAQPGWLRGGCMFGVLPLLVAVPPKPGQRAQQQLQAQQQKREAEVDEFPSLAEVAQQAQRGKRPAAPTHKQQQQLTGGSTGKAPPAPPQLLTWPGWQQAEAGAASGSAAAAGLGHRALLFSAAGTAGRQAGRGARLRGGRAVAPAADQRQADGGDSDATGITGSAAAAAAAVAAGTAVAEQASMLLGFEYESVQGHRLLLTPALLATAVQSSLDAVSVRQQVPQAVPAAGPGPATVAAAAAAAAAASASPSGPAGAAPFMLTRDLPLWLQLPGEQVAALAGKRRGGAGGGAAGASSAGERQAPVWLQLRRVLVGTPDVAVPFVADPTLFLEVPAEMLAPAAGAGGSTSSNAGSSQSGTRGTVQLRFSLPAPVPIPQGSFCALALPWLLTAPMALGDTSASAVGSGGGGGLPSALIRQSGPLKAVLASGTVVQPGPAHHQILS